MTLALIYLFTAFLFLALMLSLGFQPAFLAKLNGLILFISGAAGILLYGYGYSVVCQGPVQAMIRTLFSVFCMFLGRNEISSVSSVPLLQRPDMQLIFYGVHLLALYFTASAVIAALGSRLIRTLRLLVLRRHDINLIFGASEASLRFAGQLKSESKGHIVFVDPGPGASFGSKIDDLGALFFKDADAKNASPAFLKRLGMKPGKRQLHVFCLDADEAANLSYACALAKTLEKGGFKPDQTRLSAIFTEETSGEALLAAAGADGKKQGAFGSVIAIEKPDMLARLMIRDCPPYKTMTFDRKALALDSFECLIVGFGRTGQAALRQLIANGQFAGSSFHATIADRDYNTGSGSFFYRFPGLKAHDDWFTVIADSAKSVKFYEHLESLGRALNYIVVCTGSEKENAEIAYELRDYLSPRGVHPVIMLISENGISSLTGEGLTSTRDLYTTDLLCSAKLDRMAMVINHQYHLSEGRTPKEDWEHCDYFSRLSCRASADFTGAFLKAAGTSPKAALKSGWRPEGEILENLSITEHMRWCAFHETMGYRCMPDQIWKERAAQFEKERLETGSGRIRIGKDPAARLHACLIPWDDLDALSEKENAVTGRSVDYKEMDRDNVRMIPEMLKGAKQ